VVYQKQDERQGLLGTLVSEGKMSVPVPKILSRTLRPR